jgi:hypothetical protein
MAGVLGHILMPETGPPEMNSHLVRAFEVAPRNTRFVIVHVPCASNPH